MQYPYIVILRHQLHAITMHFHAQERYRELYRVKTRSEMRIKYSENSLSKYLSLMLYIY